MKIQLVQTEIEEALQSYLKSLVSINEDKQFQIEFIAGRGANGLTAEVNIIAKAPFEDSVATTETALSITKEEEPVVVDEAPKKSFFANM